MFLHFDFYVTAAGTRRPCARVFAVWKDNKYCFEIVYSHQQEFPFAAIVLPGCENTSKNEISNGGEKKKKTWKKGREEHEGEEERRTKANVCLVIRTRGKHVPFEYV